MSDFNLENVVLRTAQKISDNINRVLVGKEAAIELALVALGCEGHILIEDVPGVGKTMLARALAISLGLTFSRIQCTPDLLPSDITGMMIFNPKTAEFKLRSGPIMANVALVDEINRATPRTQSSLLEAMGEHQVTIDNETHHLSRPFLVMATENPVEFEGTFPLPEAQLDRFLMRINAGYPNEQEELDILSRLEKEHPITKIGPVVTSGEITAFIAAKQNVFVDNDLRSYIVAIVSKTRTHPDLNLGVSPRGTIALFNTARVLAGLRGRSFVIPEDIKYLAPYVLAHRVIVTAEAAVRGVNGVGIIKDIVENAKVPTEVAFHE